MSDILDTARHVLASHAFGEVATTWHAAADCIAICARAAPDLARFALLVETVLAECYVEPSPGCLSLDSPDAHSNATIDTIRRLLGLAVSK